MSNLKLKDTFRFSCHDGLACFKQCCRDINIFLTPYDVVRMKNKLEMSSGEFLAQFAHVLRAPGSGFPVVILKMREDNLVCPFITSFGCRVYQVRPWSCRMAPVEVRGDGIYGIAFEKSHCQGLNETKEWTVEEWINNQGLAEYNEPEELFGQIPLKVKSTGNSELDKFIMDMIFIGCYDIDYFRSIVKEHPELITEQSPEERETILKEDVALMKFAFNWLPDQLNDIKKITELKKIIGR